MGISIRPVGRVRGGLTGDHVAMLLTVSIGVLSALKIPSVVFGTFGVLVTVFGRGSLHVPRGFVLIISQMVVRATIKVTAVVSGDAHKGSIGVGRERGLHKV